MCVCFYFDGSAQLFAAGHGGVQGFHNGGAETVSLQRPDAGYGAASGTAYIILQGFRMLAAFQYHSSAAQKHLRRILAGFLTGNTPHSTAPSQRAFRNI